MSYAYRPGRSTRGAVEAVRKGFMCSRCSWVVEFDITGFYDNINHELLMKMLERRINDKPFQLRDYLFENLPELHGDSFLDKKVSDKPYRQRLGFPWMAFYFGSNVAKNDKLPHVTITLAEESENGKFNMREASVHVNAEIKPNFLLSHSIKVSLRVRLT